MNILDPEALPPTNSTQHMLQYSTTGYPLRFFGQVKVYLTLPWPLMLLSRFQQSRNLSVTLSLCISTLLAFLIRSEPENPPTPASSGMTNTDNVLTIIQIGARVTLAPSTAQRRTALENFTVLRAGNYPRYLTKIYGS